MVGAAGLVASVVFKEDVRIVIIGMCFAVGGILTSLPVFWGLATGAFRGASEAAAIAFINSLALTGARMRNGLPEHPLSSARTFRVSLRYQSVRPRTRVHAIYRQMRVQGPSRQQVGGQDESGQSVSGIVLSAAQCRRTSVPSVRSDCSLLWTCTFIVMSPRSTK